MSDLGSHQDDERRWSEWMAAANRGDKAAYQRLLSELGDVVEAYIRQRFGNLQLLEDCVQECLLAIHSARHTYDTARAFRPWMFTIVRHKTIDVLRKSRRVAETEVQAAGHALSESQPLDRDRIGALIDGVRVLEKIEPDHRDAVALTQYAGFTIPEAASRLGISESALKARLRRALMAIKKQLEAEDLST